MAVATPVLERSSSQELEDKRHDELIKERYAKLINPEMSIGELKSDIRSSVEESERYEEIAPVRPMAEQFAPAEQSVENVAQEVNYAEPYFAPSGRADAEIFRADSDLNKRLRSAENVAASIAAPENEEEENEDLRPTSTTIQYKTANMKSQDEEGGKISTDSKKHLHLSNRDIIVIAAVVTVIVALFVLIIINSAIISGINNDLSSLQSSLNTVKGAYSSVSDQISDYVANHLEEDVRRLGESLGMAK